MATNKPEIPLPDEFKDAGADIEACEASGGEDQEDTPVLAVPLMAYLPIETKMGYLPLDEEMIPEFAVIESGDKGSGGGSDQVIVPDMAYLPDETICVQEGYLPVGVSPNQGYIGIKASKGSKGDADQQRKVTNLSMYLLDQLQCLEGTMVEKVNGWKSKIQRVHPRLRKKQDFEKYYNPVVLAFGPIHHKDNELKEAERLKLNLASHFIKENDVNKEELCSKILTKIEELKECYAADLLNDYSDDQLTWMFLVDGCAVLCFIQCLVVGSEDGKKVFFRYGELETLQIKIDRIPFILRDLFLLENQLPFPLLLLISSMVSDGEQLIYSIKLLVAERAGAEAPPSQGHVREEPNHLLDLLRDFLLIRPNKVNEDRKFMFPRLRKPKMTSAFLKSRPTEQRMGALPYYVETSSKPTFENKNVVDLKVPGVQLKGSETNSLTGSGKNASPQRQKENKDSRYSNQHTFRNVTELKASGVGFKRSETNSLKAISFQPGWFLGDVKLPLLRISDDSAPIFLNLVAYEMCPDFKNEYEVTSYICFLDTLIDQPEDVAELRKANILHNLFGSDEEVAKLFNEIGTDLVANPRTYLDVKEQIDGVYQNRWKVWLAQFLNDHFSSPWTVLAFVGALFALALTLVQTWYTINPK